MDGFVRWLKTLPWENTGHEGTFQGREIKRSKNLDWIFECGRKCVKNIGKDHLSKQCLLLLKQPEEKSAVNKSKYS